MADHLRGPTMATFADLVVLVAATVVGVLLSYGGLGLAPVRVAFGFLFVCVLPGYALTAALYPSMYATGTGAEGGRIGGSGGSLSVVEKAMLAVGLSIVVVPTSILVLHFIGFQIGQETTLGTVTAVSIGGAIVAAVRRYRGPPSGTTGIQPARLLTAGLERFRTHRADGPTIAAVVLAVLLIGSGVAGAALLNTQQGERYTELSLLTVDDESGDLTAGPYPTSFAIGEPESFVVGVGNHEGRSMEYTLLVRLQEFAGSGDDRQLRRTVTLREVSLNAGAGETPRVRVPVTVQSVPGDSRYRLSFDLYRGDAPADPSAVAPYRQAHLWISIARSQ